VPITTGLSDAFLRGYVFSKPEYATLEREPYTYAENESNLWFRTICASKGAVWEQNDLETDKISEQCGKGETVGGARGIPSQVRDGLFTFWFQDDESQDSIVAGVPALAG